jgi:hypothetical protein
MPDGAGRQAAPEQVEEIRATYASRGGGLTPELVLVHGEQQPPPCIAVLAPVNRHAQAGDAASQPQRGQRLDRVSRQVNG